MHATLASYSPQLIAVGSVCVVLMKFRQRKSKSAVSYGPFEMLCLVVIMLIALSSLKDYPSLLSLLLTSFTFLVAFFVPLLPGLIAVLGAGLLLLTQHPINTLLDFAPLLLLPLLFILFLFTKREHERAVTHAHKAIMEEQRAQNGEDAKNKEVVFVEQYIMPKLATLEKMITDEEITRDEMKTQLSLVISEVEKQEQSL